MLKRLSLALLLVLGSLAPATASPTGEEFIILRIEDDPLLDRRPRPVKRSVPSQRLQPSRPVRVVKGSASWYGPGFYGRRTASGERLRKGTFTAAHRTLPFGTKVRVTNLSNGRSVVVRINDRGPFKRHRVIDLAHGAASELRMMQAGEVPVQLQIVD